MKTSFEKIASMIEYCKKYSHVKELKYADDFFSRILKYMDYDASFLSLIESQLALYVGEDFIDPNEVYSCMNSNSHLVRNRMLAWWIDHPEWREPEE